MSNEKATGAGFSAGLNRLPPGYEWRFTAGQWHRCKRRSSTRTQRLLEQLQGRAKHGRFTDPAQEALARLMGAL